MRTWWILLAALGVLFRAGGASPTDAVVPLRVAFSTRLFSDLNEKDVRGAVKVWAQIVARERDLPVDPEVQVLDSRGISNAFRADELAMAAVLTEEFLTLREWVPVDRAFVGVTGRRSTENYLVAVHRDSGLTNLASLKGRSLLVFESRATSLAGAWLDLAFEGAGLPFPETYLGWVRSKAKFSAAVLPVFFRSADACLLTRRGFELQNELNPEIGRNLRVVAESSPYEPLALFLRAGFSPAVRDRVVRALTELDRSPAGRQMLSVFRFDRLAVAEDATFRTESQLLATRGRLRSRGPGLDPGRAGLAGAPESGAATTEGKP